MTRDPAQLNPAQREAVTHGEGPLLVLAGAGSGKTRVLTYRIAHLVASGAAQPSAITAVTFTNKAAQEMKDRVEALVDGPLRGMFVGTFHRWALEILRRYPRAAGLKDRFSIIDADDQKALINRSLKLEGLDPKLYPPRMVLSVISKTVNRGSGLAAFEERSGGDTDRAITRVWRQYLRLKNEGGVVDFDDMLALALKVLKTDEAAAGAFRRRAGHLLVDEFQDTNTLQMNLLHTVLGPEGNITAVGDEDQSIYRWRGADMENILAFEKHFPGARVVALEENYRSTAPILEISGALIGHNRKRRGKKLFTSTAGGDAVHLLVSEDERAEARWAADRVEELRGTHRLSEMAILMRTNAQTRPFEEELTRRHIAYRVIGGLRFWQRAEVKDALAYLRLVSRPEDGLAFERVINVPARGIGAVTLDVLRRTADDLGLPLPVTARRLPEGLTPRARMSLERFFELLDEAEGRKDELSAGDFVGWLLEASGVLSLYDGDDEDKIVRRENLQQLAAAVAEAESQGQSLDDFLDAVALLSDGDQDTTTEAVSLMTLHSAKGLEFDMVILAGMEDGLLPHASSRDDSDGLEEERRLAYVGMTRARKWLGLSAARSRFLFGQRQATTLSRFLDELPTHRLEQESGWGGSWGARPILGTSDRSSSAPAPVSTRSAERPRSKIGKKIPPAVTDGSGTGWRPGNRVRHKRFGTGVVLSCQGRGPQLKLVVYFDKAGRKTLVPSIAKLEQI